MIQALQSMRRGQNPLSSPHFVSSQAGAGSGASVTRLDSIGKITIDGTEYLLHFLIAFLHIPYYDVVTNVT